MGAAGVESGSGCGVGVHVGPDFESFLLRRFNPLQQFIFFRPVFLAGGFDVVNLRRNPGFAADSDHLIESLEQLISLAAHVGDVFALVFGGDFTQLDELFGFRIKCRRINERRANPEGTRFHFLAHEFAHLVELFRRWLFVLQSDDVLAHSGCAEEGSDVAGDAALFQIMQILRQGVPFNLEFDVCFVRATSALSSDHLTGPSIRLRP